MVLLIVGVLAFGFFTPESFGLGPRKENLESFEAQYKAGRVVLNDPKAPVEVVLSENGSEGVIHALVYRKEIQPEGGNDPLCADLFHVPSGPRQAFAE